MSSETESDIEKRLRAFAKRRREQAGAPLELHPATRRLLQGEVARQFGKPGQDRRSFWDNLRQYWPRVAFGIAALGLVTVVAVSLWLPTGNKDSMTLARNESSRAATRPLEELRSAPSAAPAPASAETVSRDDALRAKDEVQPQYKKEALGLEAGKAEAGNRRMLLSKNGAGEPLDDRKAAYSESLKEKQPAGSAGALGGAVASSKSDAVGQRYGLAGNAAGPVNTPVAPPASATFGGSIVADTAKPSAPLESPKAQDQESVGGQFASKSLKTSPALAASTPASREVDTVSRTPALDSPKNKDASASTVLRSSQTAERDGAAKFFFESSAPKSRVLASFQLERDGDAVRIVDADGSVYSGVVQTTAAPTSVVPGGDKKLPDSLDTKGEQKAVRGPAESQARQIYSFRTVGTNLSLNQQVVFNGDVVASVNEISFLRVTNSAGEPPTAPFGLPGASSLKLPGSRVSGRARIGEGNEIEVNAVAAPIGK